MHATADRATDLVIHADHANVSRFRLGGAAPSAAHVHAGDARCARRPARSSARRRRRAAAPRATASARTTSSHPRQRPPAARRPHDASTSPFKIRKVDSLRSTTRSRRSRPLRPTRRSSTSVASCAERAGAAADRRRRPSSLPRQPCRTRLPRLFRLRPSPASRAGSQTGRARAPSPHRWADINWPRSAEYHAAGKLALVGVASGGARRAGAAARGARSAAATRAGGVAVAFALAACRRAHL